MQDKKILDVEYSDELSQSYIDYACSVIIGRAIPNLVSGLKPVHSRVLYAMHELGLKHDRPFKKSSRVCGETMGKR